MRYWKMFLFGFLAALLVQGLVFGARYARYGLRGAPEPIYWPRVPLPSAVKSQEWIQAQCRGVWKSVKGLPTLWLSAPDDDPMLVVVTYDACYSHWDPWMRDEYLKKINRIAQPAQETK